MVYALVGTSGDGTLSDSDHSSKCEVLLRITWIEYCGRQLFIIFLQNTSIDCGICLMVQTKAEISTNHVPWLSRVERDVLMLP
jgi:hypothetical protein